MSFLFLLKSLFLGAGAGVLYGISFLGHRNLIFNAPSNFLRSRKFLLFILVAFVRLSLFGLLLFYVLHTPSLNIILVLASFFGGLWLAILQKKVRPYEH